MVFPYRPFSKCLGRKETSYSFPYCLFSSSILLLLLLLLLTSTNNNVTLLGCLGFLGNLQIMNYLCSWASKNKQQKQPHQKKKNASPKQANKIQLIYLLIALFFFQGLRKPRRLTCHLGANFVLAICVPVFLFFFHFLVYLLTQHSCRIHFFGGCCIGDTKVRDFWLDFSF